MHPVDAKDVISEYYRTLLPLVETSRGLTPTGIFELNTSRTPEFVARVLRRKAFDFHPRRSAAMLVLFAAILTQLFKWTAIILASRFFYRNRKEHLQLLASAEAIFVGFVTSRQKALIAKDFDGFRETLPVGSNQCITIGLRLPSVGFKQYLKGGERVIPVMSFITMRMVFASILGQLRLYRSIKSNTRLSQTHVEVQFFADVVSGHSIASFIVANAAARLLNRCSHSAKFYFPMERHDWELLTMTHIRNKANICAVQACTFSPMDLNMYHCTGGAPLYRQAIPNVLYFVDSEWRAVFSEHLNFKCRMEKLLKTRFSDHVFPLNLDTHSKNILYLASINHVKLNLDLEALILLTEKFSVHIRLHPSLRQEGLDSRFKIADDLSASYAWCIFADTSMVFQLECDKSRLLFIDHAAIPAQDPTLWHPEFGSRRVTPEHLRQVCLAT